MVIASGSVVTKDCEPNSVYAGVPARKIGTLDNFIVRRTEKEKVGEIATTTHNQALQPDEIEHAWKVFQNVH